MQPQVPKVPLMLSETDVASKINGDAIYFPTRKMDETKTQGRVKFYFQ